MKKILLTLAFINVYPINSSKNIYLSPVQLIRKISPLNNQVFEQSEVFRKFKETLENEGYKVETINYLKDINQAHKILIINIIPCFINKSPVKLMKLIRENNPKLKDKLSLIILEPPTTDYLSHDKNIHKAFSKIYTFEDNLVDNKKYFKVFYGTLEPYQANNSIKFEDKKLCTMVISNKKSSYHYSLLDERKKVIEFFETLDTNEFDFYGRNWPNKYKNYKGVLEGSKINLLKKYKFYVCYENTKNISGYITEKIFECFAAGCVPIYWGANNIEQYIPKECFIDRRKFKDFNEVYSYIKNMDKNEHDNYIRNIKKFLNSEKAQFFSSEYFLKTLLDAVH